MEKKIVVKVNEENVPDPETAAQETDPPSRHVYASQYYYTELNTAPPCSHDLNLRRFRAGKQKNPKKTGEDLRGRED